MQVRAYVDDSQTGKTVQSVQRFSRDARDALRAAAQQAAKSMEDKGRADIAGAGAFGRRWTDGLHADVSEGGGSIRIDLIEDAEYWHVFEYGATIHGKPMLWIPLSFAEDAQGIWARDFPIMSAATQMRGPRGKLLSTGTLRLAAHAYSLFRVDRAGKAPLLLSAADRKPKYFGKESVTIPRKFHLRDIAAAEVKALPLLFRAQMRARS